MDKIIIVGAGLSGATLARLFADAGKDVTVVDKRSTIGGNAYDVIDKNGITVQPFGPHIFHTKYKEVFDFLSRFTEWTPYTHKVLANLKGKLVPVPFNLTSLYACYPKPKADRIANTLIKEVGEGKKVPILQLKNQFMPKKGFTDMITNILCHPHIRLKRETEGGKIFSFNDGKIYLDGVEFDGIVVYTGRVEEIFGYKFGTLPYRSLKFKFKTVNTSSYQKAAVVNYTTGKRYTRISEFTKFTCEPKDKTVIVKEYSKKCKKSDIPYYPVPIEKNFALYKQYEEEAKKYKKLYLLGRLAEYKYINMDVAVLNAMKMYDKIIEDGVFGDE